MCLANAVFHLLISNLVCAYGKRVYDQSTDSLILSDSINILFFSFQGAFVFEGSMVDMPLLKQAENIIKLSELEAKG